MALLLIFLSSASAASLKSPPPKKPPPAKASPKSPSPPPPWWMQPLPPPTPPVPRPPVPPSPPAGYLASLPRDLVVSVDPATGELTTLPYLETFRLHVLVSFSSLHDSGRVGLPPTSLVYFVITSSHCSLTNETTLFTQLHASRFNPDTPLICARLKPQINPLTPPLSPLPPY